MASSRDHATDDPRPPTVEGRGEAFEAGGHRRILSGEELKPLYRLCDRQAWVGVGHTVGVIAVAAVMVAVVESVALYAVAFVIMASRQQALFVLSHDAAHYRLLANRRANDLLGRLLAAFVGIPLGSYRLVHRLHHNHLYEARDPDMPLHGGYPRGAAYLTRKLLGDLSGRTAWKTYRYFFGGTLIKGAASKTDTSSALRRAAQRDRWFVVALQFSLVAGFAVSGQLLAYLVFWVLPAVTLLQAVLRLRAVCEHGAVDDTVDPLHAARTHIPSPVVRWFLFPHNVGYHIEHHLYPGIPYYHLPECHRLLTGKAAFRDAAVVPDLRQTLRRIFGVPQRDTPAVQSS